MDPQPPRSGHMAFAGQQGKVLTQGGPLQRTPFLPPGWPGPLPDPLGDSPPQLPLPGGGCRGGAQREPAAGPGPPSQDTPVRWPRLPRSSPKHWAKEGGTQGGIIPEDRARPRGLQERHISPQHPPLQTSEEPEAPRGPLCPKVVSHQLYSQAAALPTSGLQTSSLVLYFWSFLNSARTHWTPSPPCRPQALGEVRRLRIGRLPSSLQRAGGCGCHCPSHQLSDAQGKERSSTPGGLLPGFRWEFG